MKKYRKLLIIAGLIMFSNNSQEADIVSPVGEWLVKDRTAHIMIVSCNNALWGFTSWVAEAGTDENNPDPAKRSRSSLGLPILLGMKKDEAGDMRGKIYNAENGKVYDASIALKSADVLTVKGCLFNGFACGGEDWQRLPTQDSESGTEKLCRLVSTN